MSESSSPKTVERSTLIITNLIKLTGLILGIHEVMTTRDPVIMVACVVMMSGVQGLEQTLIKFFEKFFGVER